MLGKAAVKTLMGGAALVVWLAIPGSAAATVLHDQNSGGDGTGFFSMDNTGTINDSEVADDFHVPPLQSWTIRGLEVTGEYEFGSGPVSGVTVRFYEKAPGM